MTIIPSLESTACRFSVCYSSFYSKIITMASFFLQHCISLHQSAIDSDVTVLRRDPALVCVFLSFEISCSDAVLRYTSQTAHDVKKRRVEIEEEERLRTFASSGAVPVPRVQKPAPTSVKPPTSKGMSAKDVSFKDGSGCFALPFIPC